jgi:hypothetical protein
VVKQGVTVPCIVLLQCKSYKGGMDIQGVAEQIKRFGGVGGGGRLVYMVSLCSVGDPISVANIAVAWHCRSVDL